MSLEFKYAQREWTLARLVMTIGSSKSSFPLSIFKLETHSKISFIYSFVQNDLRVGTDFIRFSLTMAYGIGRNIAFLEWK